MRRLHALWPSAAIAGLLALAAPQTFAQMTPLYLTAAGANGGVPTATLSTTAPTGTILPNFDPMRDSFAGLLIPKGGTGAGETDPQKYQRWLSATGNITLSGTVQLRLWSAMKDFNSSKSGSVSAYLRNCNRFGGGCNLIATANLTVAPWSSTGSWVMRTLDFGVVNVTVGVNRVLELKLIVRDTSGDDMWFAYDTAGYASVLGNPAVASVNHYELSLPTSGISCQPTTVQVTACADASSPCTSAVTTLSGSTATLATSGGTLGATSLTFNTAGVASTTLSYPMAVNGTAVSVTLSGESVAGVNPRQCCPNGTTCAAGNSCSTTFNTAGFVVAAAAGGAAATLPAQTAGTASASYVLRAVRTSTTTGACTAALTGANTVNWALQCNNPATCSAGNLMSVNGGSATAIAGNPNSGVTTYTSVPMTFDANGNAPFTFTYVDVGQTTLWVAKTVNGAPLTGSSNAFVTRPAGFALSNIRQTAAPNLGNPAAAGAAGAKFVKAGEAFSATVSAITSGGGVTPNYGKETVPEGVLLTHSLVQPAAGTPGTLGNGTLGGASFSNGVATASNLTFSEVGIITLTPSVADGNYLGAGNVTGAASVNVGRFVPASFALSAGSVSHRSGLACAPASAFTYLGENFALGFTLTAQNLTGATTQNYTGSFAKLDPASASTFNLAGLGGTTTFSTGSGRLALGTAVGSWSSGIASGVSIIANATRAATPDGPFSASFGIAPVDSDGVAMAAYDMPSTSGGTNDRTSLATVGLRFGRLRLANAIGANTRNLSLPLSAQYWNGSTFDINNLDSCTAIPASAVSFGNLRRTLTTADTALVGTSFALTAGQGTVTLAAPTGGHYGSADVSLSLGSAALDASCLQPWTPGAGDAATAGANLPFLRGASCGAAYDKDPSARASFGLYRGTDTVLYQRENY